MSTGPKPGTLRAGTFDAFRLARERGSIQGNFDAAASERLYDWLAPGEAPVTWSITGTTDAVGHPAIAIELGGSVPLECQRCLTTMTWPVRQRTVTLLATSDAEGEVLDEGSDEEVLVASEPLDALALVEDELLLSLPYAPMHAEGDCEAAYAN
ncbi:MAG: YceD family protein [Betaproteobacteria bacterium]